MHNLKYVAYQEGKYYVAHCLNVDVSSFGGRPGFAKVRSIQVWLTIVFYEWVRTYQQSLVFQVLVPLDSYVLLGHKIIEAIRPICTSVKSIQSL